MVAFDRPVTVVRRQWSGNDQKTAGGRRSGTFISLLVVYCCHNNYFCRADFPIETLAHGHVKSRIPRAE